MKIKQFIAIVSLFMLLAVGVVVYFARNTNKEVQKAIKTETIDHMKEVVKGSTIGITSDVNSVKRTLKFFGEMVQDYGYKFDDEKIKNEYLNLYNSINYISLNDLGFLDENGILRYNVKAPQIIGIDLSFRNYYKNIKQRMDPDYIDVEFIQFKGVDKGDRGLIYTMGVFEGDEKEGTLVFKGVVAMTSTLKSLIEKYIEPLSTEHKGYMWFFESNGSILYHPKISSGLTFNEIKESELFSESFKNSIKNVIDNKKLYGEYDEDGEKFIYGASSIKVGEHNWYIVAAASEQEVFLTLKEYTKIRDLMIISIFIVIILGLSIIFIFYIRNIRLSQAISIKTYQLEYAKEVNEELDSIINTIAHDLKTPLTSVMGFSDLLVASIKDKLDEADQQYLSRIQFNANYMRELIESLLEYARVGRAVNAIEEVELDDIVKNVKVQLNYEIEKRKADVNVSEKLPTVKVDKSKITRVFANLISNAIKFVPEDRSPQINISVLEDDDFYNISVSDNGIGIDEGEIENVFKLFHRLKEIEASGTGVGLSIVKKIIEDHDGKIDVKSKKNEGTTFTFSLKK